MAVPGNSFVVIFQPHLTVLYWKNCGISKEQVAKLTGNRSYTLIVTSVLCKLAEAREDVLLRPRLCFGGGMLDVCVDV